MKKYVAIVLCFVLAVIVAGCGKVTYRIGVTIPSDSTDSFTWSDEEISPNGRKITIHSCDELGDAEIILKPVEVKEENAYDEPVIIARGKSVTLNAEKGAWFKIGIRMLDNAVPGKVKYFEIKDIEVRIASEPAPEDAVMFGKIKEIANDTLYIEAQNGNYFINNWMAYIPTGPIFEIGDEITIKYNGIATETAPAGLCGVTEIDLTEDEYTRKYGDESAEAEMETVCPSCAPEYPGVYRHAWREEIAGTVVEMNSYIVLNEDGTGCWIAQDVGMLTWEDGQLTLTVGAAYDMVLAQEGETVNLLVSDGGEAPTVFEKIDELPAQIQSLLARS